MTKHELWAQRVVDWQASGLSQTAFCQQHGWATSTFHYWLCKFQNTDLSSPAPASFLPVVIEKASDPCVTPIALNTHGLTFECSIPQLAQLIVELNRHA